MSINKNQISLTELTNLCAPSSLPKCGKDFAKADFCYYTSLYTAKKIFCVDDEKGSHDIKGFFVSPLSKMNDKNEAACHKSTQNDIYSLCLCNSSKEWVHMWHLYGGIRGRGVRIEFTPKTMLDFLRSLDVVHPIAEGKPDFSKKLTIGKDIKLKYGWVCYKHESGDIDFKNAIYTVTNANEYKDFYFIKDYTWKYENEFRLVFANKGECSYDKLFVPIPEATASKLKITFGPGYKNQPKDIESFDGVVKSVQYSKLDVDMDLVHRNFDEILDYVKTEIAPDSSEMHKLKTLLFQM